MEREAGEADHTHQVNLGGQRVHPVAGRHRGVGVEHGLQGGDRGEAPLQHLRTGRTNVKAVASSFPDGCARLPPKPHQHHLEVLGLYKK